MNCGEEKKKGFDAMAQNTPQNKADFVRGRKETQVIHDCSAVFRQPAGRSAASGAIAGRISSQSTEHLGCD